MDLINYYDLLTREGQWALESAVANEPHKLAPVMIIHSIDKKRWEWSVDTHV